MKLQDLEIERFTRSSGGAQSNAMSPQRQGDFPDCGQRDVGTEICYVSGFEGGRRGHKPRNQ